jgi:hypothetical protein
MATQRIERLERRIQRMIERQAALEEAEEFWELDALIEQIHEATLELEELRAE